jgi:hypothetical protein
MNDDYSDLLGIGTEPQITPLAQLVVSAMQEASDYKREVTYRLDQNRRAVNCQYDPEDWDLLQDGPVIYMGVTNLKVRAFRSWIADILLNAEDKPWTISPTPLPDLPTSVEDVVIDAFLEEVRNFGFTGSIETNLGRLKRVARSHMDRITSEAALNMETLIHDQLTDGGWREAFDQFIDDLGTYPAAIIKGPVIERKNALKWRKDKAVVESKFSYAIKRVAPHDIFPSPDSTTPQDGRYIVERTRMDACQLADAAGLKSFRADAIKKTLAQFPAGWEWNGTLDRTEEESADSGATSSAYGGGGASGGITESPEYTTTHTGGMHDVLIYYGKVLGSVLQDLNGTAEDDGDAVDGLDAYRSYEAEIWVTGGYVIRALLNPNPLGTRPFYATSFDPVPGSFWGRGLPDLLRDTQRVCNATVRALVKNMAFSSGPIGEVDLQRVSTEDAVTNVEPYRIYRVDSSPIGNTTQSAFRFHNIPSNAREMMEIFERFLKQADDISGIPAYVLGNPQVAGAGRTLGGLSLLMGNAAKGIKRVINQVDKGVIEPMIETYVGLNLMLSRDNGIKFDLRAVARGSTGLLVRELNQAKAVELLGTLAPFVQQGVAPPEGLQVVLRDVVKSLGYRPDELVPSPGRDAEVGGFLGASSTGANSLSPQDANAPATAAPTLDGRSGAALGILSGADRIPN